MPTRVYKRLPYTKLIPGADTLKQYYLHRILQQLLTFRCFCLDLLTGSRTWLIGWLTSF